MKISQALPTVLVLASAMVTHGAGCETAYALCQNTLSQCFITDPLIKSEQWGWNNKIVNSPFGPPPIKCTMYAGAAGCDTDVGENVGTVTIKPKSFSIDWDAGWDVQEVHFYHGTDPYPTSNGAYTVAPGQYSTKNYSSSATTWTIYDGPLSIGDYFILHASVCPSGTTASPTYAPTSSPTDSPTKSPTASPTNAPTSSPTDAPTKSPTSSPTQSPTKSPTSSPSAAPSPVPSPSPSLRPTSAPTAAPTAGKCETAFAKCESVANVCFLDDSMVASFQRWGWKNKPTNPGTFTCTLWAGAAGCDTSKGANAGTASFESGDSFSIDLNAGWSLKEVHFYHGLKKYPKDSSGKYTVAPGQYSQSNYDPSLTTWTIDEGGLESNEYFILHAVVCE
ncbi:hypothetical protein MPSEU_001102700 [Mayamaea pseudoterrestris]|nr:hypothetical protein MPSEU_001102700 [Mayamaea pseudoterrestris]